MEIKYSKANECFGISGPWIGQLQIDNRILKFKFLVNNFVKSKNGNLYAFNRFRFNHESVKLFFNLFRTNLSKREFQILIFDCENDRWYLSNDVYESLFLTRIENGQVFFTIAFHNDDKQMFPEKVIDFNNKNFAELKEADVIKNALQQRL